MLSCLLHIVILRRYEYVISLYSCLTLYLCLMLWSCLLHEQVFENLTIIYTEYWMLQHVWSPAPASMTVVCQHYFTMNCTGSTSLSECGTSLPWLSTGVSGIKHWRTSPTTAFQCPTLPVAGTCFPPAATNWLFHVSALAPLVVAPSLLLVLQSGIHCLTVCTIQLLGQTSFDGLWKPTCLPVVSVSLTVR